MQDVSSFTLAPVIGEGICVVNAAFSCSITAAHIEGGGRLDLTRKNFWRRAPASKRKHVITFDSGYVIIDGVHHDQQSLVAWLRAHEGEWLSEWESWRSHVALCGTGSFHWTNGSDVIGYRHQGQYLDFVEWKRDAYIRPAQELIAKTSVYTFLRKVLDSNIALALVHPMGFEGEVAPLAPEEIRKLYDDPEVMACMPYVVAGMLLGVKI